MVTDRFSVLQGMPPPTAYQRGKDRETGHTDTHSFEGAIMGKIWEGLEGENRGGHDHVSLHICMISSRIQKISCIKKLNTVVSHV